MIGEGDLADLQALVTREGAGVVVEAIARMRKRWSVRLFRVHVVDSSATVEVDAIDRQEAVALAWEVDRRGEAGWIEDSADQQSHNAEAELLPAADPLAELRAVVHLADVLNSRQHAGLEITPTMWGELHDLCNRAKGVIAIVED